MSVTIVDISLCALTEAILLLILYGRHDEAHGSQCRPPLANLILFACLASKSIGSLENPQIALSKFLCLLHGTVPYTTLVWALTSALVTTRLQKGRGRLSTIYTLQRPLPCPGSLDS